MAKNLVNFERKTAEKQASSWSFYGMPVVSHKCWLGWQHKFQVLSPEPSKIAKSVAVLCILVVTQLEQTS
jgi:hypothetical protein